MWTASEINRTLRNMISIPYILTCVIYLQSLTKVSYCAITCKPTSPDILGPYYLKTPMPLLQQFCTGEDQYKTYKPLLVHGYVYSADDCKTPLRARIEMWQADHSGSYVVRDKCRGYVETQKDGYYEFSTIHPGRYTIDPFHREYRPSHLHFYVSGAHSHKRLVTQMYFKGDTYLGRNDSCTVCSSDKNDLIVDTWNYCDKPYERCVDIVHFDIFLESGSGLAIHGNRVP